LDEKLLFLINREWTCPLLDKTMAAASSLDAWLPLLVVLILLVLWRGGFRARAFVATLAIVVAVNDGVVSNFLKHKVDRPRPNQAYNDVRMVDLAKMRPRCAALFAPVQVRMSEAEMGDVEGRSFPSGHTINTMSAALVAVAFYGARAAWGFVLAGVVAYSRIYTGSHWPSDVLTTIPLAFGSTLLLLALAHWLWHKQGGRLLPRVHANHPLLLPDESPAPSRFPFPRCAHRPAARDDLAGPPFSRRGVLLHVERADGLELFQQGPGRGRGDVVEHAFM